LSALAAVIDIDGDVLFMTCYDVARRQYKIP